MTGGAGNGKRYFSHDSDAYLDSKTNQIEALIADITVQIENLKQYRQIVIHDAVTGKIKVTEG